jgi:hypothetical protein
LQSVRILVCLAAALTFLFAGSLTGQAADPTSVDVIAKIDAPQFWTSFYSTAFGNEDSVTLYKIKSVTVEIKAGTTILDSFTFTRDSDQTHHFFLSTPQQNIVVQYRANTFGDYVFSFLFDYRPGLTLTIGNANSQITVKTPYLSYH